MTRNRRPVRTDAVLFLTLAVQDRQPILREEWFLNQVCGDLRFYLKRCKVALHGYVFMPDHIHLVVGVSNGGDVSEFVKSFKQRTTKVWRQKTTERGRIWQKGFY